VLKLVVNTGTIQLCMNQLRFFVIYYWWLMVLT